jgi:BON domain
MKRCPRCDKSYPNSEAFCETDGSALVDAAPAFVEHGAGRQRPAGADRGGGIECPVCGGKAEPGELICNFCGTRLTQEETPPGGSFESQPPPTPTGPVSPPREAVTRVHRGTGDIPPPQEAPRRGGPLVWISYLAAAALALAAGVWLALYLGSHRAEKQAVAKASPSTAASPAPATAGATVALASTLPVQVLGEAALAPERNTDAARKVFEDYKPALLDAYTRALGAPGKLADGMLVRIHVLPDGSVNEAAVRTSTSPNPGLDADVINSALGWKFAAFAGGPVDVDYPIIFVPDSSAQATIESELSKRIASLTPTETAEYASAQPSPTPAASASPAVAAAAPPSPAVAPAPAPPAVAAKPHPKPRHRRLAAVAKPAPSLFQRVQERLKANRKLGRVRFYTAGGAVTLYGRVFDDHDKLLAERTVRDVPGVTSVVNTLSTDTAQWAEQQNRILRQLRNAGLPNVTVKVIGRDAYLNGEVKTELERQRAATIAEGAAPVTVRSNLIRIAPGRVFGF